jgi:hypothetical protein
MARITVAAPSRLVVVNVEILSAEPTNESSPARGIGLRGFRSQVVSMLGENLRPELIEVVFPAE